MKAVIYAEKFAIDCNVPYSTSFFYSVGTLRRVW